MYETAPSQQYTEDQQGSNDSLSYVSQSFTLVIARNRKDENSHQGSCEQHVTCDCTQEGGRCEGTGATSVWVSFLHSSDSEREKDLDSTWRVKRGQMFALDVLKTRPSDAVQCKAVQGSGFN